MKGHDYTCVNCIYEPAKDLAKYVAIYKRGRLRILLEAVPATTTLFICPKCNQQHLSRDFKDETGRIDAKHRERKRKQRIEQLKQLYQ